jgi:hypothetical protein
MTHEPPESVESLARLALETLDAQRAYFRSRTMAALSTAKQLEKQLRAACEAVVNPPAPSLFGTAGEGGAA